MNLFLLIKFLIIPYLFFQGNESAVYFTKSLRSAPSQLLRLPFFPSLTFFWGNVVATQIILSRPRAGMQGELGKLGKLGKLGDILAVALFQTCPYTLVRAGFE